MMDDDITTTNANNNSNPKDVMHVLNIDLLRTKISSYLPNNDRMQVALVSKRNNQMVPRATTYENRTPETIVPVLQLKPATNNDAGNDGGGFGRLDELVYKLQRLDCNSNSLQQYQHVSMVNYHNFKFNPHDGSLVSDKYQALKKEIRTYGPRLKGITSLNFCFSSTTTTTPSNSSEISYVLQTLSYLLPSLREIDFTNTFADAGGLVLQKFVENCPRLEKFTIQNKNPTCFSHLFVDGSWMTAANNLKEFIIDDCTFSPLVNEIDAMSNMEAIDDKAESNVFLFHKCRSTVLERVSLRNAKYFDVRSNHNNIVPIPQNALIKFIKNAPLTLRWFRSNLTPESIKIVQHERPEIEFVF